MEHIKNEVEVWEELITIPTYGVGKPDKNPMFLEKRVYQGSSGKVYPFPVIDRIEDEKHDKVYRAVFLENDYLRIMILPELGGRIQRAYDKTNGYDFVYYNEVIKPALVGLLGPWISGGIEFNWPQHHRPTTFMPVDCLLEENADGSKTVRVSETDRMYGTKGMASFTLYPDKAYLEIKGQLYNPTPLPQTFLWWANPAVAVNDNTQSVFPPDVNAVMDHGKRDVSRFPIATGTYYKHDYSAGVDISRYKNIPVPTSYMAYHSDYNFVGGYDYGEQAGILHVADHHISPGKKQWTWGCGDFGKAWDRNLTDENGPYIELMTGMFTDNQPDFTWLKPFEEKKFTQYFMPYKKIGYVKNASTEVLLNLELDDGFASVAVYATGVTENARVVLTRAGREVYSKTVTLSPNDILLDQVDVQGAQAQELTLSVFTSQGRLMLSYTPAAPHIEKIPSPAMPAAAPSEIATNEQLYLTGLHIEQYRHATYLPDPYYLEGLKRDPGDSRINTAYGQLLFRRGLFAESESYFRRAIERITAMNPNPYNGEPYEGLGLSLLYQGKEDQAFDAFYKATWTSAEQERAFYYLAVLSAKRGQWQEALEFIERALVKNSHNMKARGVKAVVLRKLGLDAGEWLESTLAIDPFDSIALLERYGVTGETAIERMRGEPNTYLLTAIRYAEMGCWREAVDTLHACTGEDPMLAYYEGYYAFLLGDEARVQAALECGQNADPAYCFPNRLTDIAVLEFALGRNPQDAHAAYFLGNLWYDKKQYSKARMLWEQSAAADPSYPTVWRNLALAYYNKEQQPDRAQQAMEQAFALDETDARVFLELDQLYKKRGVAPSKRLENFEQHRNVFEKRDDLRVEYITLLNLLGRHEQAYHEAISHSFHPWEGGEGKITTQYTMALVELARIALREDKPEMAKEYLLKACDLPESLGEARLESAGENHVYYYLGCACDALGDRQGAQENWRRASQQGLSELAGAMYYNDQPADRILYQGLALQKLGDPEAAAKRFYQLLDYGEKHFFDTVKIDYFAVSLPDLQLFDEDLTIRNRAHCCYLIALGSFGRGDVARAAEYLEKTLAIDCAHQGAINLMNLLS